MVNGLGACVHAKLQDEWPVLSFSKGGKDMGWKCRWERCGGHIWIRGGLPVTGGWDECPARMEKAWRRTDGEAHTRKGWVLVSGFWSSR